MYNRQPYVDVRGVHPVLVAGLDAIELTGFKRDITFDEISMMCDQTKHISAAVRELVDRFKLAESRYICAHVPCDNFHLNALTYPKIYCSPLCQIKDELEYEEV